MHCRIAFKALKDLGVDCFSVLCQGGNQPLDEFLDQKHPSMKLWTAFSSVQGYCPILMISAKTDCASYTDYIFESVQAAQAVCVS